MARLNLATVEDVAAALDGATRYATYAAMIAVTPAPNAMARVTRDPDPALRKFYVEDGAGAWEVYAGDDITDLLEAAEVSAEHQEHVATLAPVVLNAVRKSIRGPLALNLGAGNQSAWGSPVGVQQDFNRTAFWIHPFDAADLPENVRLIIYENNTAGAVLLDTTVPIAGAALNTWQLVEIDHATIANAGGLPLYAIFHTDGKTGTKQAAGIYAWADYPKSRTSGNRSVSVITSTEVGSAVNYYFQFSKLSTTDEYAEPIDGFADALDAALGVSTVAVQSNAVARLIEPRATITGGPGEIYPEGLATWLFNSGTFAGWSGPIGEAQDFNRVRLPVWAWDESDLPTQCRVRIRKDGPTGSVLDDVTVDVTGMIPFDVQTYLYVMLTETIANTAADSLWLQYRFNGKTGVLAASSTAINGTGGAPDWTNTTDYPVGQYSLNQDLTVDATWSNTTGAARPYLVLDLVDEDVREPALTPAGEAVFFPPVDYADRYVAVLPPTIHVTEGVELNLVRATIALLDGRAALEFRCPVGRQLRECWRWPASATGAGTHAMDVYLYEVGQQVAGPYSTQIIATTLAGSTPATLTVLVMGDSIVNNGGITLQMLDRATTDPNLALTLIGTVVGSGSGNLHEGHGGWGILDFNGDTAEVSPFVNAGVFDFPFYLSDNGLATPDIVVIQPGKNDEKSLGGYSDAQVVAIAQERFAIIDEWITSMKVSNAAVKIIIPTVTPYAVEDSTTVGVQPGISWEERRRRRQIWMREQVAWFGGREAENIHLSATGLVLDPEESFPFDAAAPVSAHMTRTVQRINDPIHPSAGGYKQIGDTVWSTIKGIAG